MRRPIAIACLLAMIAGGVWAAAIRGANAVAAAGAGGEKKERTRKKKEQGLGCISATSRTRLAAGSGHADE